MIEVQKKSVHNFGELYGLGFTCCVKPFCAFIISKILDR